MKLRDHLRTLWTDPVGSNVIAGLVLAGITYVYFRISESEWAPRLLALPVGIAFIPAILIVILILVRVRLRSRRKLLIFLSAGGTCRDPMAKAIMLKLLEGRSPPPAVEVRAAALVKLSDDQASYGARHAIREMFGEDLLEHHCPELLTQEMAQRASLILVMDKTLLLKGRLLPPGRSFLLSEFVGQDGDVTDPWPDGRDSATLERYRMCAAQLRSLIEPNVDKILGAL